VDSPLDLFSPAVSAWFLGALGEPTPAQRRGWPPIARGESTLVLAPTGSGKTLAAFLVAIDRFLRAPKGGDRFLRAPSGVGPRVVYVSPLKALAVDVERNLRAPLDGIGRHLAAAATAGGLPTVDVRTGDTTAKDRARMRRSPGDILITTPESLYLLLTSAARELLADVDTLIVDEIHALVPTKRGAHLALSIERLEALRRPGARPLQRIGLSATQRPLEEAARLLAGLDRGGPRPITIVDASAPKRLDLSVESSAPGGEAPPEGVWPHIHARVVELVRAHRSSIVFVNSRRLAERLAAGVNEAAGEELALAHHGSLAREKRTDIEQRLKAGELRALVATSSLELGIDMGAVDLVVQVEAPPSVASGLQRVGRASHGVGGVSRGVIVSKHAQDLVACAAGTICMKAGEVEETRYPRNPLDVLSQQIVAMAAMEDLDTEALFNRVRRAAPFADLPRPAFDGVLDMLSGVYPSDDFADLRPRIVWDRAAGSVQRRAGSHRLAVTNGGTIPDRGLYGVFAATGDGEAATGRRVGELDEEMVFELREGDVFLLGASSWRAERITFDRVVVSPAAGQPGRMPFWHGDRPSRARAFGQRIGELVRGVAEGRILPAQLQEDAALDALSAQSLVGYVRRQADATAEVPSDRTILVERFVDEVGDWRVVVMCPFGTRVIAPWAIAVAAHLRSVYADVDVHYTEDGMAFRIPACETPPEATLFLPDADAIEEAVTHALEGTALFASRFRECASRALLLPRRDPRRRTPLWAQRKRAHDLLAVAARHPTFPIVLEAYRECLRDAFDMPGLVGLLRDVAARRVRVCTVDTRTPSPFASSVLFAFVASFIYEADAPVAERRAQALTIDFERLRELLGDTELRELLDPDVIESHERGLQRFSAPATGPDGVHDMLLSIGDLSAGELRARCAPPEAAEEWTRTLLRAGRAIAVRVGSDDRISAVEDSAKLRDGAGVPLPSGVPPRLLAPAPRALRDLVSRYARTHGPFTPHEVAARYDVGVDAVAREVAGLIEEGRLVEGAMLPGRSGRQICDRAVLDAIRRKCLARLRRSVEPVDGRTLGRFLLDWQGVGRKRRGREGLLAVVAELQGCPIPASALESDVLPARVEGYRPWDLDALCASGHVVWGGVEALGASDGRIALYLAESEPLLARPAEPADGPVAAAVRDVLSRRGAVFFPAIAREVGGFPGAVLDALWQLVWSGEVTNDTLEPLRRRASAADGEPSRRDRLRARPARSEPPGSQGRWSLRESRRSPTPPETDRRAAQARALLERYGIVTREAAHAEGIPGGFAAVYDVLKTMEERGLVRRGYFVEGRGGAQFAFPGADERLRGRRYAGDAAGASREIVLATTDPASAWGALLEWPAGPPEASRPQRAAGTYVVLRDGAPLGWLGRGDHPSLVTFLPDATTGRDEAAGGLARALAWMVDRGSLRGLLLANIDGVDAAQSPLLPHFAAAGFVATMHGLLKRRTSAHEGRERDGGAPTRDA